MQLQLPVAGSDNINEDTYYKIILTDLVSLFIRWYFFNWRIQNEFIDHNDGRSGAVDAW